MIQVGQMRRHCHPNLGQVNFRLIYVTFTLNNFVYTPNFKNEIHLIKVRLQLNQKVDTL
jgi:hypothetical protein